ncbi:MAG: hypothetical protein KDD53_05570 [Bdellovibrionales bacterium]|nr:hypothetical protein [Bdellovibrionales bacterium]
MQKSIIDRLFASFSDLETAIASAKKTLLARDAVPGEIIKRIDSYDNILSKQRKLANDLCSHIDTGNWDEVARHVNLINGLSALIRDDARAILAALSGAEELSQDEKAYLC